MRYIFYLTLFLCITVVSTISTTYNPLIANSYAIDNTQKNSKSNGVVYCTEGTIYYTNPQRFAISPVASSLSFAIYDRMLTIDPQTKYIIPSIATLKSTSPDNKKFIYTIKNGIHFHSNQFFTPTRPLNAYDVAFSFDRLINPSNPFYHPKNDFPFYANTDIADILVSVEALNNNDVAFTLNKSTQILDSFLATDNSVILSLEYAEKILAQKLPVDTIDNDAIGTGPYKLQRFLSSHYVRLIPFEQYRSTKPQISPLVISYSGNIHKRLSQLFTGECNIISTPSTKQINLMQLTQRNFSTIEKTSMIGTFLIFNTKKELLSSPSIRRCIATLIDIKALNENISFEQNLFLNDISKVKFTPNTSNTQDNQDNTNSINNDFQLNHTKTISNLFVIDDIFQQNIVSKEDNSIIRGLINANNALSNNNANTDNSKLSLPYDDIVINEITNEEIMQAIQQLANQKIEIAVFEGNTIGTNSHLKIANFIKNLLEKYSIQVKIKRYRNQKNNILSSGKFDIAIIDSFSNNFNIIESLVTCPYKSPSRRNIQNKINKNNQNYSNWCSPKLDELYRTMLTINEDAELKHYKKSINTILVNELPIIPLVYNFNKYISKDNLVNFNTTPYGGLDFSKAKINNNMHLKNKE